MTKNKLFIAGASKKRRINSKVKNPFVEKSKKKIREFKSGATRDTDEGKNDYEGFLSYPVLEAFGDYMTVHRKQSNGELRDSDNWQKGIPQNAYIKSMFRHYLDVWALHRGYKRVDKKTGKKITMIEALMALKFNVDGYAHEELKKK